jgi:CheY-like chemotaxis protein
MDGLTLARKLNADPESRTIPIVVVTSYPNRFTKKDALAAGCKEYLIKPIDTRKFAGLVSQIAEGRSDHNILAFEWLTDRLASKAPTIS